MIDIESPTRKGAWAEKLVEQRLIKAGVNPFIPSIENGIIDLIAEYEGRLYKIQVKGSHSVNGSLPVETRRPSAKNRKYTNNDYDILAAVDLDTEEVAFVSNKDVGVRQTTLYKIDKPSSQGKPRNYKYIMFYEHTDFCEVVTRGSMRCA
ncbi:group I intron-associated PD-(D/E)XK endonuclease [Paenibacillus sp. SC116]|uniref:group I intron-associated PD-(D/E)XK endonuclease n=1 Tax=Paenibacillus sp. SC116 TaxID=2968986 RepID=UPI0035C696CA